MSDAQSMAIYSGWHEACQAAGKVELVMDGNAYAVCQTHLCVCSVADTYKGHQTIDVSGRQESAVVRGALAIAELGI